MPESGLQQVGSNALVCTHLSADMRKISFSRLTFLVLPLHPLVWELATVSCSNSKPKAVGNLLRVVASSKGSWEFAC